jgi:hypothetical protein
MEEIGGVHEMSYKEDFKKTLCEMVDKCDHFSFEVKNELVEVPEEYHSKSVFSGWQTIEARFFNPSLLHKEKE